MSAVVFRRPFPAVLALLVSVGLGGCIVKEGPAHAPAPEARATVIGKEPEPAPIPQKPIPDGESSLRKKQPDQPLVPTTRS